MDTYVLLGSTSGSDRAGPAEHDWYFKVYRYPELQAMTTDYNFGHDIYEGAWRVPARDRALDRFRTPAGC